MNRVLMLIPEYGEGGAAKVFATHSRDLSPQFDITECTFQAEAEPVYTSQRPNVHLGVCKSYSPLQKVSNFLKRIHRLRRIMKKGDFSLCISHLEGANYVNSFSLGKWRKVLVMHGSIVGDQSLQGVEGWIRSRILIPLACRLADRVLVVSDGIKTDLIGRGVPAHKVVALPNYFQPEQIEALARQPIPNHLDPFFTQNRVICNLARLCLQKNQKSLIKLFSHLKPMGRYKLLFLGSGELLHELVDYARGLQLSVSESPEHTEGFDVLFLGYQSNPFAYMARCALSILTSYNEGFPLALCESIYCRTPIASVDCPTGPRQILASDGQTALPCVSERGVLLPGLEDRSDETRFHQSALTIHAFLEAPHQVEAARESAYSRASQLYSRATVLPSLLDLVRSVT